MIMALVPTWLQWFEWEANYVPKQRVICSICKKMKRHWLIFTSEEALKHKKETGHNDFELMEEKDEVGKTDN